MPAVTKPKKGLSAASLLGNSKSTEKDSKSNTKKRERVEDEGESKNTFTSLAPVKKSKRADSSAAADDEKAMIAQSTFKTPVGLPPRATDNKKVGPQASSSAASTKKGSKKSSKNSSAASSDIDSDAGIGGYPSSLPSTPQDSSDFSFGSDLSESEGADSASVSVDEFANNTLEIQLDAKTTEELKEKVKNRKSAAMDTADKESVENRGVICLSHIPFGFFEEQMTKFFSQFGTVTRLRLSRAKRSGRSRGYAFVEFDDMEVAEIVAETMNDYLMYGRRLKCEVVPASKLHPNTFLGSSRIRKDKRETLHRAHRLSHNRTRTQEEMDRMVKKLIEKEEKRREKLEAMGINYEFEGFSAQAPSPAESLPDVEELAKKTKTKASAPHNAKK